MSAADAGAGAPLSGRPQTLAENTQRLAAGQELAPARTGADELARLGRIFHDMARQLLLAQSELAARGVECTEMSERGLSVQ